jgi:benzylsuccinate CoA-transferase BbsF subunit
VFRCADEWIGGVRRDRWCAVAVFNDAAWQRCREAMGDPAWSAQDCFATAGGRYANRRQLHTEIERWSRGRRAEDVMTLLQDHQVAAGLVAEADDLCTHDPQLAARGFWRILRNDEGREVRADSLPWRCDQRRIAADGVAPLLGEHTDAILRDSLGLTRAAVWQLRTDKVVA